MDTAAKALTATARATGMLVVARALLGIAGATHSDLAAVPAEARRAAMTPSLRPPSRWRSYPCERARVPSVRSPAALASRARSNR